MLLRKSKDPNGLLMFGCVALIVANATQYFLRRNAVAESIADPVSGFLFGVAIATLLVSAVVRRRDSGRGGCTP